MKKELLEEIQIDDEDRWLLERYKWYPNHKGYLFTKIEGKTVYLHLLLCSAPEGMQVDHQDRNKNNYKKENLRPATLEQQMANRGKWDGKYTSIYKGVSYNKAARKWHARIRVDTICLHLGFYKNEIDAAKAYNKAAKKWFKEFAVLNEIPQ